MLNAHFYQKTLFLTQISKRSTSTDLHHPDLHLAQFFSLETLKTSSAYAKTSLGPKMEKFLQTSVSLMVQTFRSLMNEGNIFREFLFSRLRFNSRK